MTCRRVQWITFSSWALCASSKLLCLCAWCGIPLSLEKISFSLPPTITRWSFMTAPPWCAGLLKCTKSTFYLNVLENSIHLYFNRKTILGPTYGSPVEKVLVLPMSADTKKYYLIYITKDKVSAGRWIHNKPVHLVLRSRGSVLNLKYLIMINNDQSSC